MLVGFPCGVSSELSLPSAQSATGFLLLRGSGILHPPAALALGLHASASDSAMEEGKWQGWSRRGGLCAEATVLAMPSLHQGESVLSIPAPCSWLSGSSPHQGPMPCGLSQIEKKVYFQMLQGK